MWKLTVPQDVLENLRCSLCKEYLSQLPIYAYPDQEGVGCGRCPVLSENNPIRDVTYEAVAKHLYFPCRYKPYGCLENVLPIHMAEHEESCFYKQYFCPFLPLASCPWQGPSTELFEHYEEQHKVLALRDLSFEIDFINLYEENYLMTHRNELFVIHIKCDPNENVFWCEVRYIGTKKMARNYLYQIDLKNHNNLECVSLQRTPVTCNDNMTLDKSKAVHLKASDIRASLNDPCSVICVINILPSKPALQNGFSDVDSCKSMPQSTDEKFLRELECPVCSEYMVSPIYQCVAGHSICDICKDQVKQCPTCRNPFQDTRNYSLENITSHIQYCCKYRDFNCDFVSTPNLIKQHEAQCKYGPYECPFYGYNNCKWKGKLSDLMDHAQKEHDDNILEVEIVSWLHQDGCREDDDDCFLIKAYGEIFYLIFKYDAKTSNFFWSMQLVGQAEDVIKFQFELDVLDNTDSKQRLFVRRNCNRYTHYEEAFDEGASFIKLPLDLVSSLMSDGDLIYKCHIIKLN